MEHFTPLVNGPATANDASTFNSRLQELSDALDGLIGGTLTMTTPTITSFEDAQHDHEDAAGGGKLTKDAINSGAATDGQALVADGVGGAEWRTRGDIPVGIVDDYAGSVAPTGWLLCAGQAISRATYADLFAVIGTTYGSGDGSTTFNIPDVRGRVVIAPDNMGGTSANRVVAAAADTLGGAGGEENHTTTTPESASHNHNWLGATAGGLTVNHLGLSSSASAVHQYNNLSGGTNSSAVIQATGGGGAHNNMQPYIVFNKIIKY